MYPTRKLAALAVTPFILLGLAGCSSDPASTANSAAAVPADDLSWLPEITADPTLSAEVPAEIRSSGLIAATSSNLPPMTYVDDDDSTLVGFDVDMAKAISKRLGIEVQVTTAGFDAIIPGLSAGRYAIALSSLGVTADRQKVVDFVSYYNGGQGFLAGSRSDFKVEKLEDLCGLRVAVQSGSTQQSTLEDSAHICPDAGLEPYALEIFPQTNAAVLAIQGSQADVLYASISIVQYTADKSPNFRVAGVYKRALVGAALPKGSPMVPLVHRAMQQLIDDGTYAQILEKWGLEANSLEKAEINSAKPAS